jgi:hypothetical protein
VQSWECWVHRNAQEQERYRVLLGYGIDAYRRCHLHAQAQERVRFGYGVESLPLLSRKQ